MQTDQTTKPALHGASQWLNPSLHLRQVELLGWCFKLMLQSHVTWIYKPLHAEISGSLGFLYNQNVFPLYYSCCDRVCNRSPLPSSLASCTNIHQMPLTPSTSTEQTPSPAGSAELCGVCKGEMLHSEAWALQPGEPNWMDLQMASNLLAHILYYPPWQETGALLHMVGGELVLYLF